MNLHTRNALHQYNVRHAGYMPEMQAIKRSDTVREGKHAGINYQSENDPSGAAIVWGLASFVVVLVLLLVVLR